MSTHVYLNPWSPLFFISTSWNYLTVFAMLLNSALREFHLYWLWKTRVRWKLCSHVIYFLVLFTQTNIVNKKFLNKNDRLMIFIICLGITVWNCLFLIRKFPGHLAQFFYVIIRVLSCLLLCKISIKEKSCIFHIIEWKSFELWCISNYRIIKQNVNWGYFIWLFLWDTCDILSKLSNFFIVLSKLCTYMKEDKS